MSERNKILIAGNFNNMVHKRLYDKYIPVQENYVKPRLSFVPINYRTADICLAAIEDDAENMLYVPNELLEKEDFLVSAAQRNGYIVGTLVDDKLTPRICNEAVKQNPCALEFIPIHMRTKELCMTAFDIPADAPVPSEEEKEEDSCGLRP